MLVGDGPREIAGAVQELADLVVQADPAQCHGDWRVDVSDTDGELLQSFSFKVPWGELLRSIKKAPHP